MAIFHASGDGASPAVHQHSISSLNNKSPR
jgi:hypothetical protein